MTFRSFEARDLLDTDWYKFAMQFALFCRGHSDEQVSYRFLDRKGSVAAFFARHRQGQNGLDADCVRAALLSALTAFTRLRFAATDAAFVVRHLRTAASKPAAIARLAAFEQKLLAFDASQVELRVTLDPIAGLELSYSGPWFTAILLEVPFLAIVSEFFNNFNPSHPSLDSVAAATRAKMARYTAAGNARVIEFGTRRRYSRAVHEAVFETIVQACPDTAATSNVLLSQRHARDPKGTCAHEWFMFYEARARSTKVGVGRGEVVGAVREALRDWLTVYGSVFALTDVYTTRVFFEAYRHLEAHEKECVHFRCDSGPEMDYLSLLGAELRKEESPNQKDPIKGKMVMFSNSLSPDKVEEIQTASINSLFKLYYGIGTNFTNDLQYHSLDIVIKLDQVRDRHAFKLSDVKDKFVGHEELKASGFAILA
ncbi:Quinolinate phosphoribosyl transferase [Chytriomyces sp. MP71]|nr:Quinolinate phosphoribosyl transferase [Chytriomyces sp. MP71]